MTETTFTHEEESMIATTLRSQSSTNQQGRLNFFILFSTLALLLTWLLLPAAAQQITGAVTGTVKDQQGGMVTTATIKATNVDTGFSRYAAIGSEGAYIIQYLPVGKYTVEVNAAGFKKFVQQNLVIVVDQTQALNVVLDVGGADQTITVTEAPPLVDTTSATLGTTVTPAEIIGLPLVNRDAYALLSLVPGVQYNSSGPQGSPNGTQQMNQGTPATIVIINGGIDAGVPMVSYYLDGGINMTGLRNYGNPLPSPDALQEFRVETNNFGAQYGRMSGAVITAVTKSGTNHFHGSLFEFNRNTDLNDTPWNSSGNPPYHRNNFGGAIGGPIKRDKAFFFFSYAGLKQVIGTQMESGGILPTAAERLGDFTADASSFTVYMPGTTTQVNGTNSGPNCGTPQPNCIPSNLLDQTAANLLNYIPLPNAPISSGQNYTGFYVAPTDQVQYLGKYDETLSSKDHVAVSYFYLHLSLNAFAGGNIPWVTNQTTSRQQVLNLNDVHTINANTANQAWITFSRMAGARLDLPSNVNLGTLGSSFTEQGEGTLPYLNVDCCFETGAAYTAPASDSTFISLRDMVSKTKGKHSLDIGGEFSMEKDALAANLANFGEFTFDPSAPTSTGNAMSDFITGQVQSMEQDTPYHSLTSTLYYALFIQDIYRIKPRLTLNLGLRYDVQTAPVEAQNLMATFVPNVQSTMVPSAPLGMLFPGDSGVPRSITGTKYHHISPRLGVAWDPFGDGKTAIRAGAGIFYGSVSANEWNQPSGSLPFSVRQTFNSITSLTNIYGDPASFPTGDPFPYTYTPAHPTFLADAGIEAISKDYQWPLTYQFNAAVQRQLPLHFTTTIAYVGTLTRHVPFFKDDNYAGYAPGATGSQASIDARRPYNDNHRLGQITYLESEETASYHALQATVSRPVTHNLMLNGFYVWSHNINSVTPIGVGQGTAQDFANLWEEKGAAATDMRNVVGISGMWTIDYYKGSNLLIKQVVNGWSISPIVTLQSGTPFTMFTGANNTHDSSGPNRPNLVPNVNAFLDPHRSRSISRNEWFNPAAFTPNGPGEPGGIGPYGADGNAPRDYLRNPGYRDVDLGLLRDFHFERGIVFQLRGEATNAFNMVSMNGPVSSLSAGLPSSGGNDGVISSAASPRLIQIGARVSF
jgi:hypothetical protein